MDFDQRGAGSLSLSLSARFLIFLLSPLSDDRKALFFFFYAARVEVHVPTGEV